jgi:NitT/TauT family transport system permease protein
VPEDPKTTVESPLQDGRVEPGTTDSLGSVAKPGEADGLAKRGSAVRRFYRRHSTGIHTILSAVLAIVAWQIAASHLSPLVFTHLGPVWHSFTTQVSNGQLWVDVQATGEAFIAGFLLAAIGGVLIGLLITSNKLLYDLIDPWISALYATPLVALSPLFIVTFGIGLKSKIAIATLLAIIPVIINTAAGVKSAENNLIECAYSFGANRFQIFLKVLIPSALPFIITGLRLAIGHALVGVVVGEFFGAQHGLGQMVFQASQQFDTATVFLGVIILAATGAILMKAMMALEKVVAPWRVRRLP